MSAAFAVALALCGAVPAGARSSSRIAVDERLELLGVVQYLSEDRPDPAADQVYQGDVERRFGALRGHAAVASYRLAASRPGGEGFGILLLWYSPPPALSRARSDLRLPYLETEAARASADRFLAELREFSAAADFPGFFREHRAYYRAIERAATKELGGLDPAAVLERYLRVSLDCRNTYILSPLYKPGHLNAYILPYPNPETIFERPKEPFEVYTHLSWRADKPKRKRTTYPTFDVPSDILWHEPLYVFLDPSFFHYESRYIPEPAKFYGDPAGCRENDINCLKSFVVLALVDRLNRRQWKGMRRSTTTYRSDHEPLDLGPYPRALSTRLEEYEAGRGTIWEFYPRLFSVFSELAHPSAPAPALPVPSRPVAAASDFFDPAWRRAFTAAP